MKSMSGELHDDVTKQRLKVDAELDCTGLWVRLDGCGDEPVVRVEFWEGKPQVLVWNDANSDDPVKVDLSGAAERLRRE